MNERVSVCKGILCESVEGAMDSASKDVSSEKCDLPISGLQPSSEGELKALGGSGSDRSSASSCRLFVKKRKICDARCGVVGSGAWYGDLLIVRECSSWNELSAALLSSTSKEEMPGPSNEVIERS